MRRAVTSIGAPMRPVLRIVQPSAVRVTAICSVPIAWPRDEIMKLDVFAPASGGAAPAAAAAAIVPRAGQRERRRRYNGQVTWRQHIRPRGSGRRSIDRSARGRLVVLRTRPRVVSAGPADQRHRRAEGGRGLLRGVPDGAGADDRRPVGVRARRRHPADDAARRRRTTVLAKLDQFIFSEDVQLGDVSDTFAQIAVVGPDAAAVVGERCSTASPRPSRGVAGARQPARRLRGSRPSSRA